MRIFLTLVILLLTGIPSIAQSNSAKYYEDKAYDYIEKGDYENAIKTLTSGINEMPDTVFFYDMRGALLESFGLYEEAIQDFSLGLEKSQENNVKAHLLANRGGTKYKIRDFEGSYTDLISAIKFDSTNIDALNNLAAICEEINKTEEAIEYLNQIILIDSTYVAAYVNLGFTYQGMQEHDKAIYYFDKAVHLDPEEALAYSNRSFSKLKTNDLIGAMDDINQSIRLYPANSYAYKIRALVEIENGNISNACKDLSESSELGYTKQYGEDVDKLKSVHCK